MPERKRFGSPARGQPSNDGVWGEAARLHETGLPAEPMVACRDGRLFAVPKRAACRKCRWCGTGMADHCERPELTKLATIDREGVVPLAESIGPERAAFAGVLARAIRVAKVVAPDARALVTLVGMDAQTLITAQLLAAVSDKVRVLAVDDAEVARCDRWGIRHRALAEAGLRNDQDMVVLGRASGSGANLAPEVLPGMLRPRGRIIVTESASGTGMGMEALTAGEVLMSGVRGGCLHEAASLLASPTCPDLAGLGFEVRRGGVGQGMARFGVVTLSNSKGSAG